MLTAVLLISHSGVPMLPNNNAVNLSTNQRAVIYENVNKHSGSRNARENWTAIPRKLQDNKMSSMERSVALTENQRTCLVNLISESAGSITSRRQDPGAFMKKKNAWSKVAEAFNSMNPGQPPRTPKQLKRAWEHVKRRYVHKIQVLFLLSEYVIRVSTDVY